MVRTSRGGTVRRRLIGLLIVGALAASGCGARWSDAERAQVFERRSVPASGAEPRSGGPAELVVDAAEDLGSSGSLPGGPAPSDPSSAGAPATAAAAAGPQPCAAPSTAPGITATEIAIGGINSLSGPIPGLGQSARAATRAYVAYRNATGGVCGRKLVLKDGDDIATGTENRKLVQELEPQVLGFVGGIAGGDGASVPLLEERKVPVIGNSISPEMRRSPIYHGVNMPLARPDAATGKYRFLKAQGVRKAAVVYSGPAVGEAVAQIGPIKAAGIEIALELALPLATLSYDSAARAVANSGADYLLFIHEQGASAAMARALADARYTVAFPEYIVAYGSAFQELAGEDAEGATSWLYTLPVEDEGTNAELDQFLRWMRQTAPGTAMDTFASVAWAGAKAFMDVLEGLPGPISRPALLAQAGTISTYDAGGMVAPVRFAERLSDGCLVGVVIRQGRWQRLAPATGFLC